MQDLLFHSVLDLRDVCTSLPDPRWNLLAPRQP